MSNTYKKKYTKLLKKYNQAKRTNAILSVFKTTAQEKMDTIDDFLLWCFDNEYNTDSAVVHAKYREKLRQQDNKKMY